MQFINPKAVLTLSIAAVLSFGAAAQSLDEGVKMYNYQRYSSAEKALQPLAAGNATANYYLGLAQIGEDKIDAARATFSKYPDDAANMAGMARLAFLSKNAAEGTRIATAIADKAKKKDWQPLVYAADAINYGGGDALAAVHYYEEAIKRGGDNVGVRIGLGDAYLRVQGGGGKSMDNFESATTKDAKNSLGYSRIGKLWYDARNYNDALTNYAKAKDADPANPLPYRDLAYAYFYVGKYDLAKQNIEEYLKLSDKNCDDDIIYGDILFLGKDYGPAIAKMQEVISTCGEKPFMYRVLGYSQYETKDYNNALQNMRSFFSKQTDATKIIPSDYMYLGRIYSAMKLADSADFYYAKALASDTSSNKRKTYNDIAESYKGIGSEAGYLKAGQYYKLGLDAAADKAAAIDYFNWGVYSYYGKSYDEAAKAFETMETKFPDQPSASYWRARVAAAQDNEGKTGAAVPFFNKWLAIPETEAYHRKPADTKVAYQYLAIVAYNKGDKAGLKDLLDKLKAIDPNDPLAKQLEGLANKPAAAPAKTPVKTPPAKTGAAGKVKK